MLVHHNKHSVALIKHKLKLESESENFIDPEANCLTFCCFVMFCEKGYIFIAILYYIVFEFELKNHVDGKNMLFAPCEHSAC